MKKIIFSLFLLVLSFVFIGCNEKENVDVEETYKIYFYNGSELIKTIDYKKGDEVKYPEINVDEGYYVEWSPEIPDVIDNDMIFSAVVHVIKKQCLFYDGDTLISTKFLKYNDAIDYPSYDKEPGVVSFSWVEEEGVLENNVYKKVIRLEKVWKMFSVKFTDYKGNVLDEQQVQYGKDAVLPTLDSEYNWSSDAYLDVKKDVVIKGRKIGSEYNIYYYDGDTLLDLEPKTYKSGLGCILPVPTKDGYEFIGWFVSSISLYPYTEINGDSFGDITLYARFLETEIHERITLPSATAHFTSIKTFPHSLNPDVTVFQPQVPSGYNQSNSAYLWSSSDEEIATISQYGSITGKKAGVCVLTGVLATDENIVINGLIRVTGEGIVAVTESEANVIELCTVTFLDKDDNAIKTTKVLKGGSVIYPTPPTVEGMQFTGWDKVNYNIKEDTTIKATYRRGTNNYVGKKFSVIGDSISTFQDYIPKGYACFYPYPTADVYDVNMTWWMLVVNRLGAGMFINNSYSGSCAASGTGASASSNSTRLKKLVVGEERPDVIIIYMGSNDCGSKYVSEEDFKAGYIETIEKTRELCPEAEIVLCTLPVSNLYTAENRTLYNNDIKVIGATYGYKVLDLASVDLNGNLVDSAHPKFSGMKLVANKIVEELLK